MEEEKQVGQNREIKREVKEPKRTMKFLGFFRGVINGDFLSREIIFNNIPYLGFLTLVALVYISNTYYAEKTFRQIEKTKSELKEIRFQYVSAKSTLMYYSKLSEVSKRVQPLGLKELPKPPFKIFYNGDSLVHKQLAGVSK